MPNFRFETVAAGRSTIIEEDLASADLAGPRAVAKAAASTPPADADHAASSIKVYDDAGYLIATVNFSVLEAQSEASSRPSTPPAEELGMMRSG